MNLLWIPVLYFANCQCPLMATLYYLHYIGEVLLTPTSSLKGVWNVGIAVELWFSASGISDPVVFYIGTRVSSKCFLSAFHSPRHKHLKWYTYPGQVFNNDCITIFVNGLMPLIVCWHILHKYDFNFLSAKNLIFRFLFKWK